MGMDSKTLLWSIECTDVCTIQQAHANKRVNGFELNISEFQGDLQPKEFLNWVLGIEEVLEFKMVFDERRVSLVVRTFQERVVAW
jgi:hypothetical protein